MALLVKVIQAISDGLSKVINACKCSCKSACCESECHEKNVSQSELPKQKIEDFAVKL
jgi:hypothetical protein